MNEATQALLTKLADHGATAVLLGVTLLVLVPMILRMTTLQSRAHSAEMGAERQAHREEVQMISAKVEGLTAATNNQTIVVMSELKKQTGVLLRISESGDLPRARVERHPVFDDRHDPTPTPPIRPLRPVDEGEKKK